MWVTAENDAGTGGCNGVYSFDGEVVADHLRDHCVFAMDVAPDGHLWLQVSALGQDVPLIDTYVITPPSIPQRSMKCDWALARSVV